MGNYILLIMPSLYRLYYTSFKSREKDKVTKLLIRKTEGQYVKS